MVSVIAVVVGFVWGKNVGGAWMLAWFVNTHGFGANLQNSKAKGLYVKIVPRNNPDSWFGRAPTEEILCLHMHACLA